MRRIRHIGGVFTMSVLLTGCGTVQTRDGRTWHPNEPWTYPATRMDVDMILSGGGVFQTGDCNNAPLWSKIVGWCVVAPLYAVDLPFSVFTDTALLHSDSRFLKAEKRKEIRLSLAAPLSTDFQIRLMGFTDKPSVRIRDEVSNVEYDARQLDFIPCQMCVSNELQLWSWNSATGTATFRQIQPGDWKDFRQNAASLPRDPPTDHSKSGR